MMGGNLGAAVQMLKVMNQQGGGGQSWERYWANNTLLHYTSRDGLDLLETGSGNNRNAKILPSCGLLSSTSAFNKTVSGFETDSSGFIEFRCYLPDSAGSLELFSLYNPSFANRYLRIRWSQKKIELRVRNDSGTTFYNRINQTNASSVGWHIVRVSSSGSAYTINIDGNNESFTTGNGSNDGKWVNLISDINRVGVGIIYQGSNLYSQSNHYISQVNYNNSHIWHVTGMGLHEYDSVGDIHLTWLGAGSHLSYEGNSTALLDNGYSLWSKVDSPDEFVPYKAGSTNDVSAFLTDYSKIADFDGGASIYNFAPSLIDFDYTDSAHSDLSIFDKSNSTIHIATGSMLYYDASNVYRWRQDELVPSYYVTTYKNDGYRGKVLAKSTVSDYIAQNINEIYVLTTDQKGNYHWKFAELCTVQDLVEQVGGNPVYDGDNYLTFFFSMSEYPIIGDGVADDFAAIQAMIDSSPIGSTIRLGLSHDDIYRITQPIYLRSNRNYIIDGIIRITDGDTDLLTADVSTGAHTIQVATPSKFSVGQWITVIDDAQEYIRELYFGWGGKITDITGSVITIEGTCNYTMEVSQNARCGHSQGCVIIEESTNISVSGNGILDGNRYNQIAVLPSTGLDLHGHWEHQRCAMAMVIWYSSNITVDGITIKDGLAHSLSISSMNLDDIKTWNTNITIKNINVETGHDKNILVRFTEYSTFENITIDGNDETWEDGLIFYSDCENITVDGLTAIKCRRNGFCTNNIVNNITASNINTSGCGTRTGYGVSLMGEDIVAEDITVHDTFSTGGAYTTNRVTVNNLLIESTQATLPHDRLMMITGNDIELNNFIMRNSKSKTGFYAIVVTGTNIVVTGTGVYNHTGLIISDADKLKVTWNDFAGI